MRKLLLATLPVAAAAAIVACTGGKPALYGVVRGPDGPVAGAVVRITSGASTEVIESAATGPDGKFQLRHSLSEGAYVAEVRHTDFQTLKQTFAYPTTSLELLLRKLLRVHGIVRLPDRSVGSESVILFQREKDEPFKVIADQAGNYAAEGLVPGSYVVQATTPDDHYFYQEKLELTAGQDQMQLNLQLKPMKERPEDIHLIDPQRVRVILDVITPSSN